DDRDFCPITWFTHDFFDLNDAVVYLRYLKLKQPFHEDGVGTADNDLRIATRCVSPYFLYNGPQHVALPVPILEYLFLTRKNKLHLVVNHKDFAATDLVDLAYDYLADDIL